MKKKKRNKENKGKKEKTEKGKKEKHKVETENNNVNDSGVLWSQWERFTLARCNTATLGLTRQLCRHLAFARNPPSVTRLRCIGRTHPVGTESIAVEQQSEK